jgi:hypothetical protein
MIGAAELNKPPLHTMSKTTNKRLIEAEAWPWRLQRPV